jgi:hypothetical protein
VLSIIDIQYVSLLPKQVPSQNAPKSQGSPEKNLGSPVQKTVRLPQRREKEKEKAKKRRDSSDTRTLHHHHHLVPPLD